MSVGSALKGFFSLGADINKYKKGEDLEDGVISDYTPELKLEIEDDELIKLKKNWEKKWEIYYSSKLEPRQKENERYWMGQGTKGGSVSDLIGSERPKSDNLIFEALETFLPVATKQNPEPIVSGENTNVGGEFSKGIKDVLIYQADILKLKLKLKQSARHWALYFHGIAKIGWDEKKDDMVVKVVRPQKIILDPNAPIEDGEYTGEYIGEKKNEKASDLIIKFPNQKSFITKLALGDMGTEIQYTEWWTDEMLFWTIKNKVLDKIKNPHWNYDFIEQSPRMTVDENGVAIQESDEKGEELFNETDVQGKNHLHYPKKPYVFLTVFNLGDKPHDNTGLVEQNLPQQDIINKRQKQINKNIDDMNGGWIVSIERAGLNKQQASRLAESLRAGGTACIPTGKPRDAIDRMVGSGLPADVFNSQQDARNELRGIFGVTGLSPQGISNETTVRGKIISRGSDGDRISGISEYLEQFSDLIFNWMVQMMFVYYDEDNFISILGEEDGIRVHTLIQTDFRKKMVVSVKEGSLIPKDSLTQRNEAIDLFGTNALDPLTLYERLDFPNPQESLERLITWSSNPVELLQEGQPQISGAGVTLTPEVPLDSVPI